MLKDFLKAGKKKGYYDYRLCRLLHFFDLKMS